jgi:hypothetical protein
LLVIINPFVGVVTAIDFITLRETLDRLIEHWSQRNPPFPFIPVCCALASEFCLARMKMSIPLHEEKISRSCHGFDALIHRDSLLVQQTEALLNFSVVKCAGLCSFSFFQERSCNFGLLLL